ncbi:MAG TPA: short-chain dehydrogenase, partial [Chloroflexi bacterium]|nr:short-chain dehydrogenase [Chloroflexota bacterium]
MRLVEKVAIITGAAEGIGRSCALTFAQEGAAVVVADRNAAAGEETTQAIVDVGGAAIFVQTDVADAAAVAALVQRTLDHFGRLDVLVSNAGIGGRSLGDGPVHLCTPEAWDQIM